MVARSSVTGLTKLSENLMLPVGSKRNLIMFHKSMGSLLSKKLGFQYNHMKFATNTNMTVLYVKSNGNRCWTSPTWAEVQFLQNSPKT